MSHTPAHTQANLCYTLCISKDARYAFEVRAQQYFPCHGRVWELLGEIHGGHDRLGEKSRSRTEPLFLDHRLVLLNSQVARGASAVQEAGVEARHSDNKKRQGIRKATDNRSNVSLLYSKRSLLKIQHAFP